MKLYAAIFYALVIAVYAKPTHHTDKKSTTQPPQHETTTREHENLETTKVPDMFTPVSSKVEPVEYAYVPVYLWLPMTAGMVIIVVVFCRICALECRHQMSEKL
ncbi:hypothetical protein O0L34_g7308 [Tuta absoluta]|nr:hypothetical protein O0L34_g7308 [Tuta absoluta]